MVKSNRKWVGVLVLMGCLVWGHSVFAEDKAVDDSAEKKKPSESNLAESLSLTSRREPIRISSRDLEFLYEKKRIVYRGAVVAVQGDVTMKSDMLTVTYEDGAPANNNKVEAGAENTEAAPTSPSASSSKQRLKEIIAEGNVDITSGNRRATGKKAVFNEAQRVVTLSGEARVQELGNWVSGERVTVYLDEKRSVVEGGGGERRAEMEIRPEQQDGDKKGSKKP